MTLIRAIESSAEPVPGVVDQTLREADCVIQASGQRLGFVITPDGEQSDEEGEAAHTSDLARARRAHKGASAGSARRRDAARVPKWGRRTTAADPCASPRRLIQCGSDGEAKQRSEDCGPLKVVSGILPADSVQVSGGGDGVRARWPQGTLAGALGRTVACRRACAGRVPRSRGGRPSISLVSRTVLLLQRRPLAPSAPRRGADAATLGPMASSALVAACAAIARRWKLEARDARVVRARPSRARHFVVPLRVPMLSPPKHAALTAHQSSASYSPGAGAAENGPS